MLIKFLLVDWMACLLSLIILCLILLNMEKLGVMRLFLFRLSFVLIVVSFLLCTYTHITKKKLGARCEDGWNSDSTGSGTCSSHGGVETWRYKYWFN
jgi:hypothetical protein